MAKQLLPFIEYPNILIRNKMIEFIGELLPKLNIVDIISNFFEPMKDFIYSPSFELNKEILQQYIIKPLSRVIFQLDLKDYVFKEIESPDVKPQEILSKLIKTQKENILENDDIIYKFKENTDSEILSINVLKGNNFYEIIPKEYQKFCKQNQNEDNANILTFICKLMWLGDLTVPLIIPKFKTNEDIIFKVDDNILTSSQNFKIRYLFRTLEINLKLVTLNDFFPSDEDENNSDIGNDFENIKIVKDYLKKSQFSKWKPQGQLITTIYEHDNKAVEKLIPINNNQFTSIDNEAGFYIWDIYYENGEVNLNKNFTFNLDNKANYKILYNKTINLIDNTNFIFASGEDLYLLNPQMKPTSNFLIKLYEKEKNLSKINNITCSIGIGEDMQESQKIVFTQENGYLNIIDQRMNKIALKTHIPLEKGIVSCFYKSSDNGLYIGTLGGYILDYDIRVNSICKSNKYYSNKPIIGISTYNSKHGFGIQNKYPNIKNYLMIWTGSDDHEIGLWDKYNLNCDILFKVNRNYSNELEPIDVEIPDIIKEEESNFKHKLFDYEIKTNFNQLKYLDNIIYKRNKHIIFENLKKEIYKNLRKRFKNLSNIFQTPTTVQTAFSTMNINNENYPYIISAGNDMTIRYWSIYEDNINSKEKNQEQFCYLINAPENISNCFFSKSIFGDTIIVQSNEFFNLNEPKKSVIGFSEYQNYNGITFHTTLQNEFNEEDNSEYKTLNYCTRISDSAHKNIVSDIIPISLNHDDKSFSNFLISSSWDGTVKIWK